MLSECPKCGGESGYATNSIQRHEQHFTFHGEADNCDVTFIRGGTRKLCIDCGKDITRFIDQEQANE